MRCSWIRARFPYMKGSSRFISARIRYSRHHSSFSLPRPASSGIRPSANAPTIVGDDDEQSSLSMKVGAIEGRLGVLESTMGSMIQEIKKLYLKIDDRSLANGVYRSRHECSSNNLPPSPPPTSGNLHPPPPSLTHNLHH